MNKNYMYALLLFIMPYASVSSEQANEASFLSSLPHELCCILFGSEDASQDVQKYFAEAHKTFFPEIGTTYPQQIKKINEHSFLDQLSSFTWYGTWVNQAKWETLSENEKIWLAYHETAHKKLNLPTKQIAITVIPILFLKKIYPTKLNYLLGAFLTTKTARQYKEEANQLAARTLCYTNKKDIVKEHIEHLKQAKSTTMWDVFFPSSEQQITSLEKILNKEKQTRINNDTKET